jgi:hypothetical protein
LFRILGKAHDITPLLDGGDWHRFSCAGPVASKCACMSAFTERPRILSLRNSR